MWFQSQLAKSLGTVLLQPIIIGPIARIGCLTWGGIGKNDAPSMKKSRYCFLTIRSDVARLPSAFTRLILS